MNIWVLCFIDSNRTIWYLEKNGEIFRLTKCLDDALGFYAKEKAVSVLADLKTFNDRFDDFFSKLEVKEFIYHAESENSSVH